MRKDVRAAEKAVVYLRKVLDREEKRYCTAKYSERWTEDPKNRRDTLQGWVLTIASVSEYQRTNCEFYDY